MTNQFRIVLAFVMLSSAAAQYGIAFYSDPYCQTLEKNYSYTVTPTDYTACNPGVDGTNDQLIGVSIKIRCESTDGNTTVQIFGVSDLQASVCTDGLETDSRTDAQGIFWTGSCAQTLGNSWGALKSMQWLGGVVPSVIDPCSAAALGDPVTVFGGVETKFDLPTGQFTELIGTNELSVKARPFDGQDQGEQWIESLTVDSPTSGVVVNMSVRRDILYYDSPSRLSEPFGTPQTVEVKVPVLGDGQVLTFPGQGAMVESGAYESSTQFMEFDQGNYVQLFRLKHAAREFDKEAPRREGVVISSPSVKMIVLSTPAFEYYWGDKSDNRALQCAHLDVHFLNMKRPGTFSGLLPEIWGLKNGSSKASNQTTEAVVLSASGKQIIENFNHFGSASVSV